MLHGPRNSSKWATPDTQVSWRLQFKFEVFGSSLAVRRHSRLPQSQIVPLNVPFLGHFHNLLVVSQKVIGLHLSISGCVVFRSYTWIVPVTWMTSSNQNDTYWLTVSTGTAHLATSSLVGIREVIEILVATAAAIVEITMVIIYRDK